MAGRLEKPLTEWTDADVLALVEEGIEEGQRLEYKRELTLDTVKQRRETSKDHSGMGNAKGGTLVFGVEEEQQEDGRRVPKVARPLTDGGIEDRLQDVLDSTVTPRLNMETRLLETGGGYFLVSRVHQRSGVPHMVDGYDDRRHYIRAGSKTRPMEQHEVEAAYRSTAANEERAHRRLATVPLAPFLEGIEVTAQRPRLEPGPRLSVVTLPLDAPDPLLEMRSASGQDFRDNDDRERWGYESILWGSYAWDHLGYKYEFDTGNGVIANRLRLYRNGVFEWSDGATSEGQGIASVSVIEKVHDALGYFATTYMRAGYYGRVRVWVSLDNARGTHMVVPQGSVRPHQSELGTNHVEWQGDENVERLLHDVDAITHAAMDRLWVAYGFDRCWYFDRDGAFRQR